MDEETFISGVFNKSLHVVEMRMVAAMMRKSVKKVAPSPPGDADLEVRTLVVVSFTASTLVLDFSFLPSQREEHLHLLIFLLLSLFLQHPFILQRETQCLPTLFASPRSLEKHSVGSREIPSVSRFSFVFQLWSHG
jgi:hypothetical protein